MAMPSDSPLPADSQAGLYLPPEAVAKANLPNRSRELQAPVTPRELIAVLLLVGLCDLTIYRGAGYAGLGLLFLLVPGLLLLGSPHPKLRAGFWIVGGMLIVLAVRLVWLGSVLGAVIGFVLVAALGVALQGRRPHVLDTFACGFQSLAAGWRGLEYYQRALARYGLRIPLGLWLNLALPLLALMLFGGLFILANPALVTWFGQELERLFQQLSAWADDLRGNLLELGFWLLAAWITIGLLRPLVKRHVLDPLAAKQADADGPIAPYDSPLFAAIRNTLLAVIALFAVYLVFEFKTLWFRQFPPGFYYAGYAHQGAAWLTVALAMATIVLSLIFRGGVLADRRVAGLKKLAWIWSAENLILALAVYNRLCIYINFNGMSPMRTIGLFGISTVVVGFVLVLWKIVQHRDFVWLVRGQLAVLAIAVYLYALTPVDALVHRYNVHHVLAGDLPPAVQISVHPIDTEGVLVLQPLMQSTDPIIREGIRAMLAQRAIEAEQLAEQRKQVGWTAFQLADQKLLSQLETNRADWEPYRDDAKRQQTLAQFNAYVFQWY